MGSWNHTCMISNLPITYDQDVAVFILIQKHQSQITDHCYTGSTNNVIPIPFFGKYDDYGGVEECHGVGLNIIIETLRERLYEFGTGPNEFHDIEVRKETFDVEQLFEADHEGRLAIEDRPSWSDDKYDIKQLKLKKEEQGLTDSQEFELNRLMSRIRQEDTLRPVTHVVIHGDIFQAILEKWHVKEYVGEGQGDHGYKNCYKILRFRDLVADIDEYIYRRKKINLSESSFNRIKVSMDSFNGRNGELRNEAGLAIFQMNNHVDSKPWQLLLISEMIDKYIEEDKIEDLRLFLTDVLKAYWIDLYMMHTRRHWVKPTGTGSQHAEFYGYQVLSNAILDIINKEKQECEDDSKELEDV